MNLNEYKQTPREAGGGSFQKEGILHFWIQRQGLPIGAGVKPYIFSTLFCGFVLILPHPFPTVTTTFKLFAALLRLSQLFSSLTTLFNSSQSFSIASHLSSTLVTSSPLFSTLLNDCPPLVDSSQLVVTLLTSCHLYSSPPLPTSSHLRSIHLTSFSAHFNCSPRVNTSRTLASSSHLFSQKCFTQENFYTQKLLHREAFTHTHKSFYTEKLLQKNFYTQQAYTQRGFYTEQAFTHSKLLHREAFTLSKLFHREAFTHRRSLYTEKRLHREAFRHSKFLHTESFTERSFYTQQAFTQRSFYTQQAFTQRSFTQSKLLRRSFYTEQAFAQRSFLHPASFHTENLLHRMRQNGKKSAAKAPLPTFLQPLQYDLQLSAAKDKSITPAAAAARNLNTAIPLRSANTELQSTIELRRKATQIAAPKPGSQRQSRKTTILNHLKGILKGKSSAAK